MSILKKEGTLHGLFLNKLEALYDVELQITKALPKLAKKVTDPDLKEALEHHLQETEVQVQRLEQCFSLLDEKPKKLKGEAIRGMASDATWVLHNVEEGPALDANIIAAAQYVEHYEIAGYGTAAEWARLMKHTEVKELLDQTLEEEKSANDKLTSLAETKINRQVAMGME